MNTYKPGATQMYSHKRNYPCNETIDSQESHLLLLDITAAGGSEASSVFLEASDSTTYTGETTD
jgi:hypothetical protein